MLPWLARYVLRTPKILLIVFKGGVLAIASILALREVTIDIVSRLGDTYSHQKAQSGLLHHLHEGLQETQGVIQVVNDQQRIQTAEITSQLAKIEELLQQPLDLLKDLIWILAINLIRVNSFTSSPADQRVRGS